MKISVLGCGRDFMEYIEDESVYWMDGKQEATEKTYMLESIRDDIFYQTN